MNKHYLLFLIMLMASSCMAQHNVKDVEWLMGKWNRTNTKPGKSSVEYWQKISDTEMGGKGVSMNGADTAFVEKFRIIVKDKVLYYEADVPENKAPVLFKFTSLTSHGFVCENPQHDFPKKIAYRLDGKKLIATISGDGKQIDFLFERIE